MMHVAGRVGAQADLIQLYWKCPWSMRMSAGCSSMAANVRARREGADVELLLLLLGAKTWAQARAAGK